VVTSMRTNRSTSGSGGESIGERVVSATTLTPLPPASHTTSWI
jgi:hypothetical protein